MYGDNNQFKDLLIQNRHSTYQQQIRKEFGTPVTRIFEKQYCLPEKEYLELTKIFESLEPLDVEYFKSNYFTCWFGCKNSYMNYKPSTISTRVISYNCVVNGGYKCYIKDQLWLMMKNKRLYRKRYYLKDNRYMPDYTQVVNIDGIFMRKTIDTSTNNISNYILYTPKEPYGLKLNNIPMLYIKEKYKNDGKNLLLTFAFDMETYAKMVHFMLRCYRYKYILFRFLPKEIIRYILLLTSLC